MPLDFEGGEIIYGDEETTPEGGGFHRAIPTVLDEGSVGTYAGYATAHFINFLCDRKGEVSYKQMLDAYSWSWTTIWSVSSVWISGVCSEWEYRTPTAV